MKQLTAFEEITRPADVHRRWLVSTEDGSLLLGMIQWDEKWKRFLCDPYDTTALTTPYYDEIYIFAAGVTEDYRRFLLETSS